MMLPSHPPRYVCTWCMYGAWLENARTGLTLALVTCGPTFWVPLCVITSNCKPKRTTAPKLLQNDDQRCGVVTRGKRSAHLFLCVDSRKGFFPGVESFSFCVSGQPGCTAFLCGASDPPRGGGRTGTEENPLGSEDPIFGKTFFSWLFV